MCLSLSSLGAAAEVADAQPGTGLREQALSYEHGAGVRKDVARAIELYCQAARAGDAESLFNLGWIYAMGRGVTRNDAWAAFFFAAAARHGIDHAGRMLQVVGEAPAESPECLREEQVAAAEPVLAEPAPQRAPSSVIAPKAWVRLVTAIAPAYRVEPDLVLAIMAAESNFDPLAVSAKNARGLMQLIPETAARFKVRDVHDPEQNIRGGIAYLRWLLSYFEGDLRLVTAAYNAGEGAVERYQGIPPFSETRHYVERVLRAFGAQTHPFDPAVTAASKRVLKACCQAASNAPRTAAR